MNYRITHEVEDIDFVKWDEFISTLPDGNIFQSPGMYRVYQQSEITVPGCVFAFDASDELAGVLLYFNISYKKGLLKALSTRAIIIGGPLVRPGNDSGRIIGELLKAYLAVNKGKVIYTEVRNVFSMQDLHDSFETAGFRYTNHLNYLIDLKKSTEELWAGLKKDARNSIRKAEKNEVVVRLAITRQELQEAYELLRDSYQKIQLPLMPFSFFEIAFTTLSEKGHFKCLLAEKDGKKVGAAFRLLYNKTITAWYICSLPEYNKFKIQDSLNWFLLKWGTENGFEVYDFGGAGKPGQEYGPRKYKSKFNGELTEFGRYTFVNNPLLFHVVSFAFGLLRKFNYVNR